MTKQLSKVSVILWIALLIIVIVPIGHTTTVSPDTYLDDLPSGYFYTVRTNGTWSWVTKYDGSIAYDGTDATTVINWAYSHLTTGRDWKEGVQVIGDYTLNKVVGQTYALFIPSYTYSDWYQAHFTLASGQNVDVVRVQTGNDNRNGAVIKGGKIDGNKAAQTTGDDGIYFYGGANSVLEDIDIQNTYHDGLSFDGNWSVWGGFHNIRNVKIWYAGRYGVFADANNDLYFYRVIAQSSTSDNFYLFGTNFLVESTGVYAGESNFHVPPSASSNQFIDCYANYAGKNGFRIESSGNRIINPHVDSTSHSANLTYSAIYVAANYTQIIGGSIRADGWGTYQSNYGLYIESGKQYNVISGGARFYDALTAQIHNLGDATNHFTGVWNGTSWVNT